MRDVVFSAASERDLAAIWSFIADDNRAAANRVVRTLHATIERIAEKPTLGIRMAELPGRIWCKPAVRRTYVVFYEFDNVQVRVVRVLHGARDHVRLLTDTDQPESS